MMQDRAIPIFSVNSQTYENSNRKLKTQKQTSTSTKSPKITNPINNRLKNTSTPYTEREKLPRENKVTQQQSEIPV